MEVGATVLTAFIGLTLIILILTIFVFIWYSGLLNFVSVSAGPPPCGFLRVVYKYGMGPYKNVGSIFTEVTSIDPKKRCFGVYYDDPEQVSPGNLRWAVGCILSEAQETVDATLVKRFESDGYKCYQFPAVDNVVKTSFPYRSSLSVLVGVYRAYPEMAAYIRRMKLCAHPFMEVYADKVIHCYAPLSKQECFYVPETFPDYVDPGLTSNSTSTVRDPGEGTSGSGQTDTQTAAGDASSPKHSTPKPAGEAPHEKSSAAAVPGIVHAGDSSQASVKSQAGIITNQPVIMDTKIRNMDIQRKSVPRKSNSLNLRKNRESEPTRRSKQSNKLSEVRSRSVTIQDATVSTDQHDGPVERSGLNHSLDVSDIVQDSGVTSTVRGTPAASTRCDSFSDRERSLGASMQSIDSTLSTDRSFSCSYSGSSFSDVSQNTFSQSGVMTDSNSALNVPLVELSSDSEGEQQGYIHPAVNKPSL